MLFLSCLSLKAGEAHGAESIPLEAYAIPVKERRQLPPKSQVASLSHRSSPSSRYYQSHRSEYEPSMMLSPMVGATLYSGNWNDRVQNGVTSGLALDIPFSDSLSGELAGGFGSFNVRDLTTHKDFNQYWAGGGMKYYFTRAFFVRPFLGLGIEAVNYDNLSSNDQWMGVTGASVGMDIHFTERFALAARGGWHHPLVNRASAPATGLSTVPGMNSAQRDISIANDDFFRLMGAVKVSL